MKELLIAYMHHVYEQEGVSFVAGWHSLPKGFTKEMWVELLEIARVNGLRDDLE